MGVLSPDFEFVVISLGKNNDCLFVGSCKIYIFFFKFKLFCVIKYNKNEYFAFWRINKTDVEVEYFEI